MFRGICKFTIKHRQFIIIGVHVHFFFMFISIQYYSLEKKIY